MAEFSKQYVDKNPDLSLGYDFDILEEAKNIEAGYYLPLICEGYGFIAIAKDTTGEILLAFEGPEYNIIWENYNKICQ